MTIKRNYLNHKNSPDSGDICLKSNVEIDCTEVYYECHLDIRDCSRKVELNFCCYDLVDYNDRLKKIKILQNYCSIIEAELKKAKKLAKKAKL